MEKGYRHWGHDITPVDTPVESGLGFAVGWDKGADFIGRAAVEAQRGKPITKRLVAFKLDEPHLLWTSHRVVSVFLAKRIESK